MSSKKRMKNVMKAKRQLKQRRPRCTSCGRELTENEQELGICNKCRRTM